MGWPRRWVSRWAVCCFTLSTKSTKKFNVVHKEGVFWAAKVLVVKVGSVLFYVVHKVHKEV